MITGFLSDEAKITIASTTTAGAAAQTAITSSAINMAGYDACLFIVPIGTIATSAVTSIKLQQSDDDAASDAYSDLLGSGITVADDDDNKLRYIDINRPQKQYLKCVVTRGTADATIGGIVAVQYKRGFNAQTGASHGTNVSGEQHNFPAEGTA